MHFIWGWLTFKSQGTTGFSILVHLPEFHCGPIPMFEPHPDFSVGDLGHALLGELQKKLKLLAAPALDLTLPPQPNMCVNGYSFGGHPRDSCPPNTLEVSFCYSS